MGDVEGVDQNAGDEKSREREEEIDADKGRATDNIDEIEESAAGIRIRPEEMVKENQQNREAANAVESRDVSKAAGVIGVLGSRRASIPGWLTSYLGHRRHGFLIGIHLRCLSPSVICNA